MYSLTFTVGETTITKTANNEAEVTRLVYIYTTGTQQEKQAYITEVLNAKPIKKSKIETNEHL